MQAEKIKKKNKKLTKQEILAKIYLHCGRQRDFCTKYNLTESALSNVVTGFRYHKQAADALRDILGIEPESLPCKLPKKLESKGE